MFKLIRSTALSRTVTDRFLLPISAAGYLALAPVVQAGASAEDAAPPRRSLDLNAAIALAVKNNFGVSIRRLEKSSAVEDVEIARAAFDPEFNATATENGDARVGGVNTGEFNGYNATLSQKIITGAVVSLNANASKTDSGFGFSTNDPYDAELHFSVRQPLLRGGGTKYNRAPITLSKIAVNESDFELRKSILDLVRNVEIAYWEVALATREKELREETVGGAERLLSETKERGNVGLATGVESLQAEASLAARREELIVTKQAIEDRTDRLLLLLGKLDGEKFQIAVPTEFPAVRERALSDADVSHLIARLPDYLQFDNVISRRKLLVDRARNEALPIVDLTLGAGYIGFGSGYGNAFDQAFRHNQSNFQATLEMRVPLGFRQERATLHKRKIELEIDQLRKLEFEQTLRAQIREAARAVTAGNERVRVTSSSFRLSNQQFEQLRAKFREGLTSFRDMLLVQDDLRDARIRAVHARLDVVEASIRLSRFDGSLLARYGLFWSDPAEISHK